MAGLDHSVANASQRLRFFPIWFAERLMAVKWRNWKMHFTPPAEQHVRLTSHESRYYDLQPLY